MAGVLRRLALGRGAELLARSLSSTAVAQAKVAVILSGCGVYDGSEIHEASAVLVHLSRHGADVAMFAPDMPQMHVVDHIKGEPSQGETRSVLVESARIARGHISPLSTLSAAGYDAVVFPGGFGAAKNLSTYATEGVGMKVHADVERVLKEFLQASKPIGLCCISPVLIAKVLPGVEVTVGSDQDPAAQAINSAGAKHVATSVTEAHVDSGTKVVTTPAYMCEARLHHIFDGIGNMISAVMKFIK